SVWRWPASRWRFSGGCREEVLLRRAGAAPDRRQPGVLRRVRQLPRQARLRRRVPDAAGRRVDDARRRGAGAPGPRRARMKRAALLLALAGCRHAAESSSGPWQVPLSAPSQDEVVATVDGRPIRAGDVATQARAAGTSAQQALQDLVDAELLAGEAARRGLEKDHDVQLAVRQTAARRLLETTFEKEVTPASLSERDYRRAYNAQRNMFDHSEYVDTWHILSPADAKAPPEEKQAARAVAEEIARRARGIGSAEAFKALADQVAPPPGKKFKIEQIITA